tara:strand:- start:14 stop:370 length:357 start_codon:yes stop_codon:yes gene_type:complete
MVKSVEERRTSSTMMKLMTCLKVLQTVDPRMQLQTAMVFLTVSEFGPCNMSNLRTTCGLSGASVSRNCASLGKIHRHGKAGFGLIKAYEDVMDRKQKIVELTPKGENLRQLINDAMER